MERVKFPAVSVFRDWVINLALFPLESPHTPLPAAGPRGEGLEFSACALNPGPYTLCLKPLMRRLVQGGALKAHNGEPMIDLHGQHAAEGVAVLRRELARLRAAPAGGAATRSVYICVGTGSHTKVHTGAA